VAKNQGRAISYPLFCFARLSIPSW